jgi:hypothetical protein
MTKLPSILILYTAAANSLLLGADWPNVTLAERFGELALACVHREYPNKISHVLSSDSDVRPPRELTPVFFGCYDWHSAVHGHWLLAKVARSLPDAEIGKKAFEALSKSFTSQAFIREADYFRREGRVSFERPYGLAWLLQLSAELREWEDPEADSWRQSIEPLERIAAARIKEWVPKLTHPIRIGEHSQTAFAFGLILDWARIAEDLEMERLLTSRARDFYLGDRDCPMSYEPSGHDFLSPCIAEADLMRRVLVPERFSSWLAGFLPGVPREADAHWLEPAVVSDPGDPKLAHLDGLNLSRAWMIEGIISGLPPHDPRIPALEATAKIHRKAGLGAVTGEHYEGSHWLGSFAIYLVSGRGLP